jgi:hypothetical protein
MRNLRSFSSGRLAVLGALALAEVALSAPAGGQTPLSITYRTMIDSGNSQAVSMSMRVRSTGPRVRMDLLELPGAAAMVTAGMYMIADGGDSTYTMVMPGQRMGMIMPTSGIPGMSGPAIEPVESKIDRIEDHGPSETMLGHATRRYTIAQSATVRISVGSRSCVRRSSTVSEMWIAPGLMIEETLAEATGRFARAAGAGLNPTAMLGGRPPNMPKGTVLKSVGRATERDSAGTERTMTVSFEVTEVSTDPVDAGVFAAPSDFRMMDMRQMLAGMRAGALGGATEQAMANVMASMCGGR